MSSQQVSRIDIFDFDGTLCLTPEKPKDWKGGWWGNKVSLQPPFIALNKQSILNETVAEAYLESVSSDNRLTVMMTGRHGGLKQLVLDILNHYGITPREHHPRERAIFTDSHNTLDFKKKQMQLILSEFPAVEELHIWEDRETHIEEFRKYGQELIGKFPKLNKVIVYSPPAWHLS